MTTKFMRITTQTFAWWSKPLNGSSGSKSYLMRGVELPYQYQGEANVKVSEAEEFIEANRERILDDLERIRAKAEKKRPSAKMKIPLLKEEQGVARMVKGIRGAIRHSVANILYRQGIAYCSPTQKERFKGSDEPTLLEGEHLMGACKDEPCPIRQLFGMLGEESPIRVWSDAIVQTDKSVEKITPQRGIAFVHVSSENRHAARRDKKTLQDFSEQYFSGKFNFYVEFSKELPKWLLGLLIEGILQVKQLGRGGSSGYGRVELKAIAMEEVSLQPKLGAEKDGKIAIIEEEVCESKNELLQEALATWRQYKQGK